MSKEIVISDMCSLFINDPKESEWEYAVNQGDVYGGGLMSRDEFNALAFHAPIMRRMVEYIKCDYVGYAVDYLRACMRDKLISDIAELEKQN